ncbi:MAG TPA: TetR family transcriptional regulator C-terminal domain-containing protein [Anaeromyxobacteraceae bacterium]|nr:TetR family transcriptional regulator C-terminal domain-containing protein [Anaeromyxobacteraceae bacterium]
MATRDPQATRDQILEAAFRAVYERGMAATSLDDVLAKAGVTKGALYHHFDGKQALGCALVDERLAPMVLARWVEPIAGTDDPVSALQALLRSECTAAPASDVVRYGCPLNNLAQEMASTDDELRRRLDAVVARWVAALRDALARGQGAGTVRRDADPARVARFVVASIEGAIGLAKTARDPAVLRSVHEELATYLESLRPAADGKAKARGRRRP